MARRQTDSDGTREFLLSDTSGENIPAGHFRRIRGLQQLETPKLYHLMSLEL